MGTHVPQRASLRKMRAYQVGGCLREKHLIAMPDRKETNRTVESLTEVVAVTLLGVAGVQRHAHAQRTELRPVLGLKGLLGGNSGSQPICRDGKSGMETISPTFD